MNTQLIIAVLATCVAVLVLLIAFWPADKPTPTLVAKPAQVPPTHAPQFKKPLQEVKTPFQTHLQKEIEAELDASRNHTINHFKSGAKPHPEPKKR